MHRILLIALIALLAGCTDEEKALYKAALTGEYVPTAAELSQYSALIEEHEASKNAVSSEPEVVVAYVEPEPVVEPEPTWHIECPEPYEWRGMLVQDPCYRVYD